MAEDALHTYRAHGLLVASAVELPFPACHFDFVTGFMSFMDVPETDRVLAEAYRRNPRHRQNTMDALRKVRALCTELGILKPGLWKMLGVWDDAPASALRATA